MGAGGENRVTFETVEGLVVARLHGREISSLEDIDQLLSDFKRKIDTLEGTNLVVDFSEVQFVATNAINLLLILLKRIRVRGGDLFLCCVPDTIAQVFNLMQINKLLEIFPTRQAAQAALVAKGSTSRR